MNEEKKSYRVNLLNLSFFLFFFVAVFFYLSYANPQYDSSYFTGDSVRTKEALIYVSVILAVAFLAFIIEHYLKGKMRDYLLIVCSIADVAVLLSIASSYFSSHQSSDNLYLMPRIAVAILSIILALSPMVFSLMRMGKEGVFVSQIEDKETMGVCALLFLSSSILSLFVVCLLANLTSTTWISVFSIIAFAVSFIFFGASVYFLNRPLKNFGTTLKTAMYFSSISFILPIVPMLLCISAYFDSSIVYELYYHSLMNFLPSAVLGLVGLVYFVYVNNSYAKAERVGR